MKALTTTGLVLAFALASVAQSGMLLFQPGPGQNNGSDQGGWTDGKDTWTWELTGQGYPSAPEIAASPVSTTNTNQYKAYMQFDFATLPYDVDSVILRVHFKSNACSCVSNCTAPFYFYYLNEAWDESTLDWNNAPMEGMSFAGPFWLTAPNDYGVVEIDFTDPYQEWAHGRRNNYGFVVYSPQMGDNNGEVSFRIHSSDHWDEDKRPALMIYPTEKNNVLDVATWSKDDRFMAQRANPGGALSQDEKPSNSLMSPEDYMSSLMSQLDANTVELNGYPNPAVNYYTVEGLNSTDQVQWFDLQGRMIQPSVQYGFDGEHQYDVSALPSGVYLIEVRKGNATQQLRMVKAG